VLTVYLNAVGLMLLTVIEEVTPGPPGIIGPRFRKAQPWPHGARTWISGVGVGVGVLVGVGVPVWVAVGVRVNVAVGVRVGVPVSSVAACVGVVLMPGVGVSEPPTAATVAVVGAVGVLAAAGGVPVGVPTDGLSLEPVKPDRLFTWLARADRAALSAFAWAMILELTAAILEPTASGSSLTPAPVMAADAPAATVPYSWSSEFNAVGLKLKPVS